MSKTALSIQTRLYSFTNTHSQQCAHGRRGAGPYLQESMGERRGTPWTGCQSIAGQHRATQGKLPCTHPFT
ncbi:hypothetical protein ATANTOWER_014931 [Ataeniobius toweri]|uniref:Uncharacterized protein n=1 Tax=Ataeniobius toweri TaxID=208326 RepID=A0ABU7CEB2_9TELE|nr:hypothetical protein [Ataeniobius toweri]